MTTVAIAGPETLDERRIYDLGANEIMSMLAERGLLPVGKPFAARRFHRFRALVERTFIVEESSISTLLARVLWGIGRARRPAAVLVLGCASGNALVWLAGWPEGQRRLVGLDPDGAALAAARENFRRAGIGGVELVQADGHAIGEVAPGPYDVVFIDADDPREHKAIYRSLLTAVAPQLAPNALILAHDVVYPRFAADVAPYLAAVRDQSYFPATITLELDPYGLEVTVT